MRVAETPHQISLFRSRITTRRFDDETLRILETVLVSRDVKSLVESRSSLRNFMRSESLFVIREIADKSVQEKLSVLQFFVRAFALLGDIESCLALKYEALLLREFKAPSYLWLQVTHTEWLNFAQHALDNGFFSIAIKAFDNSLLCLQNNVVGDTETGEFLESAQIIENVKRLKDNATKFAASRSVQAQAAEYLERKTVETSKIPPSFSKETQTVASAMFRNGIKKRHERQLRQRQSMQQKI
ncbi:hypothetical protein Tsubulata_000411 [Turnera subulata]|uniref:Uncharacterized protein n=1 Tax=Turnera subulata TaxID=218843 RepID=A0A9Q0G189_9ROSI|nr:hypothetical protein Tsubulata_000411 [Turnera subulata]